MWSSWKGKNDLEGTFYSHSEGGSMTQEIFYSFMVKFINDVKERPILLIYDGHLSHMEYKTLKLAKDNGITIIRLPPHTTDLLQPLDVCCFGPIKRKWSDTLEKFQNENQRLPSNSEFVDLLCSIWHDGLKKENIISGFYSTGIYPPNKFKYPRDRLDPEKLKRYESEKKVDVNNITSPNNESVFYFKKS